MPDNETFDPSELDEIMATPVTAVVKDQPRDIRSTVELAIMSIDVDTPLDDVKEAIVVFNTVAEWVKDQKKKLDERLISVLKTHGRFNIGPLEYWLGFTKPEYKCVDVLRTLIELMKSAEVPGPDGEAVIDWSVIAGCLSSGAFKPATTRKQLPKLADELFFLPEAKAKVEDNAPRDPPKPKGVPSVQVVNTDFIR